MPARINNLPAYSVLDLSHKQNTSFTGSHATSATGTPQNMIDKNLTTLYRIDCPYTGLPLANECELNIDYGNIYWNCQLYFNWDARTNGSDSGVYVSADGTNWTKLTTTIGGVSQGFPVMSMRYVKFYVEEIANVDTWLKVYECRLMGS